MERAASTKGWLFKAHDEAAHQLGNLSPSDHAQRDDKDADPLLNPQRQDQDHGKQGYRKRGPNPDHAAHQTVYPTQPPPASSQAEDGAYQEACDRCDDGQRQCAPGAG